MCLWAWARYVCVVFNCAMVAAPMARRYACICFRFSCQVTSTLVGPDSLNLLTGPRHGAVKRALSDAFADRALRRHVPAIAELVQVIGAAGGVEQENEGVGRGVPMDQVPPRMVLPEEGRSAHAPPKKQQGAPRAGRAEMVVTCGGVSSAC